MTEIKKYPGILFYYRNDGGEFMNATASGEMIR